MGETGRWLVKGGCGIPEAGLVVGILEEVETTELGRVFADGC